MLAFLAAPVRVQRGGAGTSGRAVSRRRRTVHVASTRRAPFASASPSKGEAAATEAEIRYEDDGARVVPVDLFVRGTADETVAGVYGVLDEERVLSYVGMSRDVAASALRCREEAGEGLVSFIQVMTFRFPQGAEMQMVRESWLSENGSVPVGNRAESAWPVSDPVLEKEAENAPRLADETEIVSPFAGVDPTEAVRSAPGPLLDLTEQNVDTVLDDVRPMLMSDGGNVSVISVNPANGRVELKLEGACGSCGSATMTMQMGVERALRDKFGDQLGEVVAVSEADADSAPAAMSVELCEKALDEIRSALKGLGGSVTVLSASDDVIALEFQGPNNLRYGIELLLKDKFPGVKSISFQ